VYKFAYPVLAVQACLDLSKIVFRDRDLGTVASIGSGEAAITSAEGEIQSVLMTLNQFRVTGTSNGVIF